MSRYMMANVTLNTFGDRPQSQVEDFLYGDDVIKLAKDVVDACSDFPNDVTIIWDTETSTPVATMSYDCEARQAILHYVGTSRCERFNLSEYILAMMER